MTELSSIEQSTIEDIPLVITEAQVRAQGVVDQKSKSLGFKQRAARMLITVALPFMSAACNSIPSIVNLSNPFVESAETKAKRNELLTDEQLKEANIQIVRTPDVNLKLKRSVFDFDVFKDAKDGKLKELVVVLVDHPNLSWNAGSKLPKDIQTVYRASMINPKDRLADQYSSELTPAELEKATTRESENNNIIGVTFTVRNNSNGGSDVANYMKEKGHPEEANRIYRRISLENDTKLWGKVFIFVAVGGEQKPIPDQSYPTPDQFKEIPGAHIPNAYSEGTYRYLHPEYPGVVLRHEDAHYNGAYRAANSEYSADTGMFDSISSAWKRKQDGDESGYPFVFETAEGLTITKNIAQKDSSTPAV